MNKEKPETCKWNYSKFSDFYETSCGKGRSFGDLIDNEFDYCPYCGKLIEWREYGE